MIIYILEVILFLKNQNQHLMFRNHFKVSIRSLYKKKQQSAINFVGLIISIISFLVISLFIFHEISIRRVLGAGFFEILKFLSRDFAFLPVAAAFLAVLFGTWLSDKWLANFAYRANISPVIYGIAVFSVLVISLVIVSLRTFKIFISRPVETLQK